MKTRICNECNKEKSNSEFYKNKAYKGGLSYTCKECQKEYYQNNKEYFRKKNKDYYQKNREKILKNAKEYQQKNKDKSNKRSRKYYQEHKKEISMIYKNYRKNHPFKSWVHSTLKNHKTKGFIVNITSNELENLAKKIPNCSICGKKLKWKVGRTKSNSPTLDRINNKNILNLNNIQIICWICNISKSNRSMNEFIDYCEMIVNKFKKRKGGNNAYKIAKSYKS